MWRERCNVVGRARGLPCLACSDEKMRKSLLRLLSLWLAPILVLAIGGGYLFAGQPPGPRAAAYTLSFLIALAYVVAILQRNVSTPAARIVQGLTQLRAGSGPIPKELPVQRIDELGDIAREASSQERRVGKACRSRWAPAP